MAGDLLDSRIILKPVGRPVLHRCIAPPAVCPTYMKGQTMPNDTLTITDNRTGESYEIPVTDGTIKAKDLRQIKTGDDDFGLMSYDPAFTNTASTRSTITFLDGDKGILRHRGYPIEQLAEQSSYLETA